MLRCYVIEGKNEWKDYLPLPSDSLATVKYHGDFPLSDWPAAWAVEWDSPLKGKNSGVFNNRRYFHCIEGRGSFIKDGGNLKVITEEMGMSLTEAWVLRYNISSEPDNELGGIKWAQNVRDNALKEVNLSGYAISHFTKENGIYFLKVEKLNLSFNLISTWGQNIKHALKEMGALRWLSLSGLRFLNIEGSDDNDTGMKIDTLLLARCMFRYTSNWTHIVNWFYDIRRLSLAFNEFVDGDFKDICSLNNEKVNCLEINDNNFTELNFEKSMWPSLEILEVSNCLLNGLLLDLPLLKTLNIAGTSLCSSLDSLRAWIGSVNIPEISSIKFLSHQALESFDYSTNKLKLNPQEEQLDYDVILGLLSISFPKLTKINGTVYTNEQLKEFQYNYTKYTTPMASTEQKKEECTYNTIVIEININDILERKTIKVKEGTSWVMVHGALCRQLDLKPGSFTLRTLSTTTKGMS